MLSFAALWLACLVTAATALHENVVLKVPEVVRAGEPFTVTINLTDASWPNEQCPGPGNCDWEFLRTYLSADPTYTTMTDRTYTGPGKLIFWRNYCYLEGCIATNVTSFNTTIPASSFPNGYPYTLEYSLFNINPSGSEDMFSPTFAGFDGTTFNLTASTGNWSEFTYQKADYGLDGYLRTIPCSAVPCVEQCQTEFVEPYVPFPRKKGEEMDACVEKCRGKSNPNADCIVQNVTDTEETEPSSFVTSTSIDTSAPSSAPTSAFTSASTSALTSALTSTAIRATATPEKPNTGVRSLAVGYVLALTGVSLIVLL